MDTILSGVLTSSYPENLKKQLINKIAANGSQPQPVRVIRSVLELSVKWYLESESELAQSECLKVYKTWAKYNMSTFETFFDREFLLHLLSVKCPNEENAVILLSESLHLLQRSVTFSSHLKVVEAKAISYVREHPVLLCLKNFADFLKDFKDCIPKGDFTSTFCVSLIHALSLCTCSASENTTEIISYIKNVESVCDLIFHIWNNTDSEVILDSLKAIFRIISDNSNGSNEPSFCLGAVVRYVPKNMIDVVVRRAINSNVDNRSITLALQRIIDWLQWPTAANIDQWIVTFLRSLASINKYSILIKVTESKIEQVCEKLQYPAIRDAAMTVLVHMLLSFQHSPEPFHTVLPQLSNFITKLKAEDPEKSSKFLERAAELVHCCIFLHAGYPDLYDPILEELKDYPVPSTVEIKKKLAQNQWTAQKTDGANYVVKVTQKSETGKTGLFNLGNTCYMNSIIQALYMCDEFRRGILGYQPIVEQKMATQLQLVFAFLSQTQRPAYAPMTFSRISRPPWFISGHQQDCSEYVKYLLDQLHEQEVSRQKKEVALAEEKQNGKNSQAEMEGEGDGNGINLVSSIIEHCFGGRMATTYTCLNCGYQSSREEMFTDMPLAFPEFKLSSMETTEVTNGTAEKEKSEKVEFSTGVEMVESKRETEMVEPTKETEEEKTSKEKQHTKSVKNSGTSKHLHLNDLLQFYLQPEKLTGENQYFCEKCNSLQDGERNIQIVKPPNHLIFSLLRFSYDVKLQSRSKIFRDVKYPRTLILPVVPDSRPESAPSRRSLRTAVTGQIEKCGIDVKTKRGEVYSLSAVVVHSGTSSESGHYYTYARPSLFCDPDSIFDSLDKHVNEDDIDFLQDKWYLFNDSRVSYANYSSFCDVTKRFTKDTAYVLFYRRIDPKNAESQEIDLNKSINTSVVDPPLRTDLRQVVSKDNTLYLQEQENSSKKRTRKRPGSSSSASWYNYHNPDDKGGPPGSCGSGGFDTSGPRFVF